MIYPLAGLSFFKGKTFYWLATVRTLASECQRWNNSCCSSPRPNWPRPPRPAPAWWRRPPPAWAGSPQRYLCSKFLHKIVIGPRDPNKTINTQLVTRLTLAISPHRILRSDSLCWDIRHKMCYILILDSWMRVTVRLQGKWGRAVTPIRMSVSRLTTVNINQVLASSPITRMAFLPVPPRHLLCTMIPDQETQHKGQCRTTHNRDFIF